MLTFAEVRAALTQAAAQDSDAPADLVDVMRIEETAPIGHPVYVVRVNWTANASASIGYDRTEHYTAYRSVYDSTLRRSRQEPYTASRTVTDWQPFSGSYSGSFIMRAPASELSAAEHPAVLTFSAFNAAPSEIQTNAPTISAGQAEAGVRAEVNERIRIHVNGQLPGQKRRQVSISANPQFESKLAYVSLYSCDLDYKGARIPCVASATHRDEWIVNFPKSEQVVLFRRTRARTAWLSVFAATVAAVGLGFALPSTSLADAAGLWISGALAAIAIIWITFDGQQVSTIRSHIEDSLTRRNEALSRTGQTPRAMDAKAEARRAVKARPFLKTVVLALPVLGMWIAAADVSRPPPLSQRYEQPYDLPHSPPSPQASSAAAEGENCDATDLEWAALREMGVSAEVQSFVERAPKACAARDEAMAWLEQSAVEDAPTQVEGEGPTSVASAVATVPAATILDADLYGLMVRPVTDDDMARVGVRYGLIITAIDASSQWRAGNPINFRDPQVGDVIQVGQVPACGSLRDAQRLQTCIATRRREERERALEAARMGQSPDTAIRVCVTGRHGTVPMTSAYFCTEVPTE